MPERQAGFGGAEADAGGPRDPLATGLAQLDEYLGWLGLDEGVLVIFDCRSVAPPIDERTRFEEAQTPSGRRVMLLRA